MQFNVHALDTQQQVVALSLEAASEAAARDIAQSRGLSVFSVEGKRQAFALPRLTRSGGFKPALFSIELLALLEAGLNLVQAMQTLAEKEAARERGQVLGGVLAAINRRQPFSPALAAFPQHFSPPFSAPAPRPGRSPALRCARRSTSACGACRRSASA